MNTFGGSGGSYLWLLAVLALGLVVSLIRRLIRLALLLGVVVLVVVLWRTGHQGAAAAGIGVGCVAPVST